MQSRALTHLHERIHDPFLLRCHDFVFPEKDVVLQLRLFYACAGLHRYIWIRCRCFDDARGCFASMGQSTSFGLYSRNPLISLGAIANKSASRNTAGTRTPSVPDTDRFWFLIYLRWGEAIAACYASSPPSCLRRHWTPQCRQYSPREEAVNTDASNGACMYQCTSFFADHPV